MDFGLRNFHPNTIDDGFLPIFHPNTTDYGFWPNFHPSPIDYGFRPNFHPITTSRRFKCVPQILGSLSIHIFKLLFSFVEQFPTIRHVSEDRKLFTVGEIFYLSLGKLEKGITMITSTRNAPLQDRDF